MDSGKREYTEELRKKISDSLKDHYAKKDPNFVNVMNIENHRKAMAKTIGRKVYQYTPEGKFLKSYDIIKEAACAIGKENSYNSIPIALDNPNRKDSKFIWKTTGPSTSK